MIVYRERVLPSASVLLLPVLLFPSVIAVMLPLNAQFALPVAAFVTAIFVGYIFFSAPILVVSDDSLTARGATIELKLLGTTEIIPKEKKFDELGRKLDARAWLSIQASVRELVKIEITDPNDPTPYWLVSTRRPEALIQALKR